MDKNTSLIIAVDFLHTVRNICHDYTLEQDGRGYGMVRKWGTLLSMAEIHMSFHCPMLTNCEADHVILLGLDVAKEISQLSLPSLVYKVDKRYEDADLLITNKMLLVMGRIDRVIAIKTEVAVKMDMNKHGDYAYYGRD